MKKISIAVVASAIAVFLTLLAVMAMIPGSFLDPVMMASFGVLTLSLGIACAVVVMSLNSKRESNRAILSAGIASVASLYLLVVFFYAFTRPAFAAATEGYFASFFISYLGINLVFGLLAMVTFLISRHIGDTAGEEDTNLKAGDVDDFYRGGYE
jgi:protein-S-isoprenylcysteine O-methyltransferase Ste14